MGTQNQSKAGENPVPDLHALKASLQELKKRFLNSENTENKFATQNKEFVLNLLKSISL
jgi:hypothetical protein